MEHALHEAHTMTGISLRILVCHDGWALSNVRQHLPPTHWMQNRTPTRSYNPATLHPKPALLPNALSSSNSPAVEVAAGSSTFMEASALLYAGFLVRFRTFLLSDRSFSSSLRRRETGIGLSFSSWVTTSSASNSVEISILRWGPMSERV